LKLWANDLRRWLGRTWDSLTYKDASAVATQDGLILWDTAGYPVVSKDGEWRQLVLANGYAILGQDVDITAAAADTAYEVALDEIDAEGITLTGTPATSITFLEAGLYSLAFTAQISSTSAAIVNFRFWPKINGSDVTGSTIVASLHEVNTTTVVSRTALFNISANDVLKVMWATDNVNGYLHAHAATAYAPAAPSVTLAIHRVQQ
jgi:hypothetical protein